MPRSGDTINRAFIPKGTGIGGSAFGLIRNVKAWGENAKLFHPERWLEGSAKELHEKHLNLEMVIRYRKYQCLGQNVARMDIKQDFLQGTCWL